ncbi:hypothetical protein K7X08_002955 [Anisodus acutangulus]|uniref:Uncharacterized protein n=1 Tax=Anisodus acutangulus TaxID=402998 RepID=A0A9Q1MCR1_9SOLA|nr:hypothetical protein K7X08_002955 [Anisodus acutangulus]
MALLKFGLILSVLLMATAMNTVWFSKTQVLGARDVKRNFSQLERRLLPQLNTCERICNSDSDCSDCWICCRCRPILDNPTISSCFL